MVSYQRALDILKEVARLGQRDQERENVVLRESVGRVLAEDLYSPESVPSFDNSAMDGFAVHFPSLSESLAQGRLEWPVGACIAAGESHTAKPSPISQAVEIMTGAPLPSGFTTVIKIEDVEVTRDSSGRARFIKIQHPIQDHQNIRSRGGDFMVGHKLLSRGQVIQKQHLLALASLGLAQIPVVKRQRAVIISTGKEIVPFETQGLTLGQVRNSTALYLEACLKEAACDGTIETSLTDKEEDFLEIVKQQLLLGTNLLISTGGVSMGKYDFVKAALQALGAEIHFHRCAIRPGKPVLFASFVFQGTLRYFFGVPGNPVSTAVGMRFFILPFLQHWRGQQAEVQRWLPLLTEVKKPEGLRCFFKAEIVNDGLMSGVRILPGQASYMVSPLLIATSWVILPEEGETIAAGTPVEVLDL